MMKKKWIAFLVAVMCLCALTVGGVAVTASAENYKAEAIEVGTTPSSLRMDGQTRELFTYVNSAIDWSTTAKVEIEFRIAAQAEDGTFLFKDSRYFAIVMNDISGGGAPDYTKLKFASGGTYYDGIQFDFKSDTNWGAATNFQVAVYGGAAQVNAGAHTAGWGAQFGADDEKGSKESGANTLQNLVNRLWYGNYIKLTITRDLGYYNFNFYANDPKKEEPEPPEPEKPETPDPGDNENGDNDNSTDNGDNENPTDNGGDDNSTESGDTGNEGDGDNDAANDYRDPDHPVDYTFSVKRNCVTGTGDFVNNPYIGFYCLDLFGTLTTDLGYDINSVVITPKEKEVFNEIAVPFAYRTMLAGQEVDYEATVTVIEGSSTDSTEATYSSSDENVAIVQDGKLKAVGEGKATITATSADGITAETVVNVIATLSDSDLKYKNNYAEKTTVTQVKNGIYYSAELNLGSGVSDYSRGKLYIDEPLSVNKFISFDFTAVIEENWAESKTYYNFILNDLYDAKASGEVNIDKLDINDPPSSGLNGMQFRFFSGKSWEGWSHNLQFARIAFDGQMQEPSGPHSANLGDNKILAVNKAIWTDQKINVRIDSTQDAYLLTLTAYNTNGTLSGNYWQLSYPKSQVNFPHNPYFGIMVNNAAPEAQKMGFVITNFMNGYVDTLEIEESSDTPYELQMGENDALTVKATYKYQITPPDDFDTTITWSSSDTDVVTVDEDGTLTGITAGNAIITATDSEGNEATCAVAIDIDALTLTSDSTINAVYGEDGATVTATIEPATAKILFETSDATVVTVDEDGKLTYSGVGTATITVRGGMKSCTVSVTVDVVNITINRTELALDKFDVVSLRADSNGAPGVTWSSSDTSVVIVDANGKLVAVGAGSATVTVSLGSKTAECSVTVKEEALEMPTQPEPEKPEPTQDSGCKSAVGASAALPAVILMLCATVLVRKKAKQ